MTQEFSSSSAARHLLPRGEKGNTEHIARPEAVVDAVWAALQMLQS